MMCPKDLGWVKKNRQAFHTRKICFTCDKRICRNCILYDVYDHATLQLKSVSHLGFDSHLQFLRYCKGQKKEVQQADDDSDVAQESQDELS